MYCACPGRIRWGNGDIWKEFPAQEKARRCNHEELGNKKGMDAGKHCECAVRPGSLFYEQRISPGSVPLGAPPPGAPLVVSCEALESGRVSGPWGREQWRAMAGICTPDQPDGPAGPRALNETQLRHLVKTWVDLSSVDNYRRLYDKDGWLDEAFVNFVGAAPPDGKYARMNYQLIRSVHLFSTKPVIVVHFGMAAPLAWDPKEFPRLVVLHAAPLPNLPKRRFCFNKYRAMLVARVRTGIQLDSDQFVAPGVDALFRRAAEESSEDYPMPILPVHFLTNEQLPMWPKDEEKHRKNPIFTSRFCPGGEQGGKWRMNCSGVPLRWGHAHPTWTFWALPWLGRWLRRHLRDETLPAHPGRPDTALRVGDIPEDEALLNVGTWNDLGHKQWCKYDNVDPRDFYRLLKGDPAKSCGASRAQIVSDPRYHPQGAAVAFYTAHHAVDPDMSTKIIDELRQRHQQGTLPKPILFNGCFFADGKAMRDAFPGVRCII